MKKIYYIGLLLLVFFAGCKKKEPKPLTTFVGMNQHHLGQFIPLFEFYGKPLTSINYAPKASYQDGIMLLHVNYKLTYSNQILHHAIATWEEGKFGPGIEATYAVNDNGQIVKTDFNGKRDDNLIYKYDTQNRLISIRGSYEQIFTYDTNGNLSKVISNDLQGRKRSEVSFEYDNMVNPLHGVPLSYLGEETFEWLFFSLSKNNIKIQEFVYYDTVGTMTSKRKYIFEYSYDEQNRPLTLKKYFDIISKHYYPYQYVYR